MNNNSTSSTQTNYALLSHCLPLNFTNNWKPTFSFNPTLLDYLLSRPELSTGRMDPRVGSGRVTILPDFGGSGRVSTSDFLVFYWLFLGTWIDVNLRILHSDLLIFYDIWYDNKQINEYNYSI